MFMKFRPWWWIETGLCALLLIVSGILVLRSNDKRSEKRHSAELEYLKSVNSVAPPKDPELTIGGSKVELIPAHGGETRDAMLIYLPEERVMFMGEVIMPYLGGPFSPEGDLQGLFDAIDEITKRSPQYLLHGHEPLTRNFTSPLILSHLKTDLTWLRDQVLAAVRSGDERAAIHERNLVPPDLLAHQPDVHQPYYILREHVIDRLYDQSVGYWQADLQGLAHPSRADRAALLVDYLDLSEAQIVNAANRLAIDGRYAMAAELLETAEPRFPNSEALKRAKRLAYLKLMEKNQNTDPFKFIIYSAEAGELTPQINAEQVNETRGMKR
jgi:alkyl sulfatase BDS1-like metallo-beta-lactamase superfamily hydrolase